VLEVCQRYSVCWCS